MTNIRLTYHARHRMKERRGLPPRAAHREAIAAFRHGLPPGDPNIPEYMLQNVMRAGADTDCRRVRAHNGSIFVFARHHAELEWGLVTVLFGNPVKGNAENNPTNNDRAQRQRRFVAKKRKNWT